MKTEDLLVFATILLAACYLLSKLFRAFQALRAGKIEGKSCSHCGPVSGPVAKRREALFSGPATGGSERQQGQH